METPVVIEGDDAFYLELLVGPVELELSRKRVGHVVGLADEVDQLQLAFAIPEDGEPDGAIDCNELKPTEEVAAFRTSAPELLRGCLCSLERSEKSLTERMDRKPAAVQRRQHKPARLQC